MTSTTTYLPTSAHLPLPISRRAPLPPLSRPRSTQLSHAQPATRLRAATPAPRRSRQLSHAQPAPPQTPPHARVRSVRDLPAYPSAPAPARPPASSHPRGPSGGCWVCVCVFRTDFWRGGVVSARLVGGWAGAHNGHGGGRSRESCGGVGVDAVLCVWACMGIGRCVGG